MPNYELVQALFANAETRCLLCTITADSRWDARRHVEDRFLTLYRPSADITMPNGTQAFVWRSKGTGPLRFYRLQEENAG